MLVAHGRFWRVTWSRKRDTASFSLEAAPSDVVTSNTLPRPSRLSMIIGSPVSYLRATRTDAGRGGSSW